jgi:hypothetical protein
MTIDNEKQSREGRGDWQPIATAPWQTVVEVRNAVMEHPVLATRGYQTDNGVHPDDTFFTSVYTPDPSGFGCFAMRAGCLVCPTEWRKQAEAGGHE